MMVIRVLLTVRDEVRDEFEAQAREDAKMIAADFEGCTRYDFFRAMGEGSSYLLYEEWKDRACFEAYRDSEQFQQIGARLRPLLAAPPSSAYYDVQPTSDAA